MTEHEHSEDLDALAAAVRQRRAEAVGEIPVPRPEGCQVCRCWRLKEGETRDGEHVCSCPVRNC